MPISVKQEGREVRTEVKNRGYVDGLEAIDVQIGEIGSMLYTKLIDGWEVVRTEAIVERDTLKCRQRPVRALLQEILE